MQSLVKARSRRALRERVGRRGKRSRRGPRFQRRRWEGVGEGGGEGILGGEERCYRVMLRDIIRPSVFDVSIFFFLSSCLFRFGDSFWWLARVGQLAVDLKSRTCGFWRDGVARVRVGVIIDYGPSPLEGSHDTRTTHRPSYVQRDTHCLF